MKTLLLKFAGPLQSWGTNSLFQTRSTNRYPSKSGVIGILAASFGFLRDDVRVERFNQLDYAVRVDQPGKLLNDYHVARSYKPNGNLDQVYVTNRYYLQDAIFIIALGSDDEEWMNEIEFALKNPYFQPFLGRRSNPLTADFFIGIENKDVMSCLERLEWQASDWHKKRNKGNVQLPVYADAHLVKNASSQMVKDRAISFSQKERIHGYRAVARKDIVLRLEDNDKGHDAFSAF